MTKTTAPKKPVLEESEDWHPADVVAALRKVGWSLTQLGIEHGYSHRSALPMALHKPYPKAEGIIAEALDLRPDQIWPSRYTDGKPNRRRGPAPLRPAHHTRKATTARRGRNTQGSASA